LQPTRAPRLIGEARPMQARNSAGSRVHGCSGQRGYAMAVLLVAMGIMAVMMTVAMPVWKQMTQREKEEELIFRGLQYARAVGLYGRKYANANPPSIDVLVQQRFLRRKYKDPITQDDFLPLLAGQGQGAAGVTQPGGRAGAGQPAGTGGPGQPAGRAGAGQPSGAPSTQPAPLVTSPIGTPGAGGTGGIIGVASKSKEKSIRLYNGRTHYNEWAFVYTPPVQAPGTGAPGTAAPGQRSGQPQRGQPGQPPVGPGGARGNPNAPRGNNPFNPGGQRPGGPGTFDPFQPAPATPGGRGR
jgi:type II secretory pathway pseudopilin PulG